MTKLIKWSPFSELTTLHKEMDDLFKRFFGAGERVLGLREREEWYPAMESFISKGSLIIRAELPGVDPKDVDISIVGNHLTIKGDRRFTREMKEEECLVKEISYGAFERSMTLPEGGDINKVHAKYAEGILEITMPVPKELAAKKVEIEYKETPERERVIKAA
jgi:HSP20 family protein